MPSPVILLTGFEPFGGEAVNASWRVASALNGERIAGARVVAVQLPCVFGRALQVLAAALRRHSPQLVLALGQAAGRAELSLERVAVNVDDARMPDNAGLSPVDMPIVPRGPAAYFSTLPIKAMAAAAAAEGVAAGISQSAGTFVCNHVFYGLQRKLRRASARSGFMHVPLLPEQADSFAGLPVMALEDQVRGTRAALKAAMQHADGSDLRVTGGAIA
jgi:pyroglutamyl-peptidase